MKKRKQDRRKPRHDDGETRDKKYLEQIAPYIVAAIRQMPQDVDYFIFVHESIESTTINVVPREDLREMLASVRDQSSQFALAIRRVCGAPSHPTARWIVLARDRERSVSACSVLISDLSKPIGSA